MGISTNGILAYGYDLGSEGDGWSVREVDDYGQLTTPWAPDEDEDDADMESIVERVLLEAVGFTETDYWADGYYERKRAAEATVGVELVAYCSGEYPMYVLAASSTSVRRGFVETIDPATMTDTAAMDERLAWALGVLCITPMQEAPAWLLASYYSY